MSIGMHLLLILLGMIGAAFFNGIETGLISIHRMRLRHFVREGIPGAAILQSFLNRSDRLLGTVLVGNNLLVVIVSVVSTSLAMQTLGSWGEPLSTLVTAVLVLIFCEYLPKAWFQSRPFDRSRRFARLLLLAETILRPITVSILWLTGWTVRESSRKPAESVPFVTRDDLKILVVEGEQDGVLSPRERFMIHRVFELSGKAASQIMIPREKMTTIPHSATVAQFYDLIRQNPFTRIPVLDSDANRFVGVVNVFYVLSKHPEANDEPIATFARPPLFVPAGMPVDQILPRMRRFRQPMCLVTGKEGEVLGLITTEDILEEIVGDL